MARFLRLRWAVAQIGARRGGRRSLALLPTAAELPGPGWRMIDERCWRSGVTANEPWERRARAMGSVTAWRSFEQRPFGRWLWSQVIPLASDADGVEALKILPSRLLTNRRAEVTVTSAHGVDGLDVPGAHAVWAEERTTAGEAGPGVARMLAWVADSAVAALSFASVDRLAWGWDELTALAKAQSARQHPAT